MTLQGRSRRTRRVRGHRIRRTLTATLITVAVALSAPGGAAAQAIAARRASPDASAIRTDTTRITVAFDQADIREVLTLFAEAGRRTIVVGRHVTGTVTAEIRAQPWRAAFHAILQAHGLAFSEDADGIITVDSYGSLVNNQALEPIATSIVDINYAKAASLVPTVRALLARDCSNLAMMQAGRELAGGATMGGGMLGARGTAAMDAGCVVRGSVTADSATNKLIISDAPTRLAELVERVRNLDIRTPQVAIRAKIVFVNRSGIQDIGLAYDVGTGTDQFFQQLVPRIDPATQVGVDRDGDGTIDARSAGTPFTGPVRIALGGNAMAAIANANSAIRPDALNLIYATALGRFQLTAFVNALESAALAEIQSEPRVTILNNRTAEIFVGQEIPIRVIDASASGGINATTGGAVGGGAIGGAAPSVATYFPRASVQIKEAGIRLSVTPQVTHNRMVLLDLRAENSSAEVGPSDVGIIFNQQRAESRVLVRDGEAAVIGGLTVIERSQFRSGIPYLMRMPLLGRLFSQTTRRETKRDLLIMVTPHIQAPSEAGPERYN